MNRLKKLIICALAVSGTVSCNFLDIDESVGKSSDYMYGYFSEVEKLVTNIYGYLPSDWGTIDGAIREAATDNAVHVWSTSNVKRYYDGSWSAINTIDNVWGTYYEAIRAANKFLAEFSLENLERFQDNADYEEEMQMASYYPYEVRFLRAFYYFELIKRYKDVPLVKTVLTQDEVNSLTQTPFSEVADFIVTECDEIKDELPVSYAGLPGAETGRATRGAAMALKARVLLYAASPLFNEGENVDAKYEAAARAAWDLIKASTEDGWYSIVKDEVFWGNGNTALESKQLIFECRGGNSNSYESKNFPVGYEGGNTGTCPSQNLVDAFECSDGTEFDWSEAGRAASPYTDRDPRLSETVLYNGSTWKSQTIEVFEGGRNGAPQSGATLTGYYLKKTVDESISLVTGSATTKPHHYILFRYAEVLLNYAEAMLEWKKNPDYKDSDFTMSPVEAINEVRKRTGAINLEAGMSEEDFREKCRNERRVELAFEDHRFWDIRRWKIGPETTDIYGVEVSIDSNTGQTTYNRVLVQERRWEDKMYLYPIPQSERLKNNNLGQNPGW